MSSANAAGYEHGDKRGIAMALEAKKLTKKSQLELASTLELGLKGLAIPRRRTISRTLRGLLEIPSLILLDLSALALSLLFALVLRQELLPIFISSLRANPSSGAFVPSIYLGEWPVFWLAVTLLFFLAYEGLYQRRYSFWQEAQRLTRAVILAMLVTLALVFVHKTGGTISRPFLLLFWLNLFWILPLVRYWGKRLLAHLGLWQREILILGAGETGRLLLQAFRRDVSLGYHPIAFLDDDAEKQSRGVAVDQEVVPVLGPLSWAEGVIAGLGLSDVVVAIPGLEGKNLVELVNRLQRVTRNVLVVPDLFGLPLVGLEASFLYDQQALLLNVHNNLADGFNVFLKRFFDLTLSLFLLPFLLPVMAVIAVAIKLDSPGPIFYSHRRIGRGGKEFRLHKFRSMVQDADKVLDAYLRNSPSLRQEWERDFKLKHDPRITRVGRIIRKLSLDELPQLFNVIKGEMSLVGPRPIVSKEVEKYGNFIEYYFAVRPGVTGLWQVSGRNDTDYATRVQLDAWYVRNWSFLLDLILLVRTIRAVLKKDGAY